MKTVLRYLNIFLLTVGMVLLSACSTDVSFTADERVEILSPKEGESVELPFEVRWKVKEFTVVKPGGSPRRDAGYFALFFDRSPMAPGRDLESLAEDDPSCVRRRDCPDEAYLNERNVYTTTETVFEMSSIIDTRPPRRPQAKEIHDLTLVLLNGAGERIGDSAFSVRFVVERP